MDINKRKEQRLNSSQPNFNIIRSYWGLLSSCALSFLLPLHQPTGGPYGPVNKTYELPKVPGTIYYVSSEGKAEQSGKTLKEPTTFAAAITRVKTGDAIVMRSGTYRTGNLLFNQGKLYSHIKMKSRL